MSILNAIGAGLDFMASKDINEANQKRDAANIQATKEREGALRRDVNNFGTDFSTSTDASGVRNLAQRGGGDAATAREAATFGDVGRINNINDLTANFSPTVNSLEDARGIIGRDRELQQSSILEPGLNKLAEANKRQFGGLNNSGASIPFMDRLKELFDSTRIGGEQDAINLFQGSGQNDLSNLQQAIAANALHAPAPGFQGEAGSAAPFIAQTPVAQAQFSDVGGAAGALAGSNLFAQLAQQQAGRDAQNNQLALIRALGDEGAFSNASG
jgi:hypothetical protein